MFCLNRFIKKFHDIKEFQNVKFKNFAITFVARNIYKGNDLAAKPLRFLNNE